MNDTKMQGLKLIERIEFHEGKSRNLTKPYIETQFYVTDLEKFLAYCSDEKWKKAFGKKSTFDYHMKRIKKSRAKRPKFNMHINRDVIVYPKENMCSIIECGLHYVCQHSFDILPYEDRAVFYGHFERDRACIGMLFGLDGSKRKVFTTDILDGFMLHREQINKYDDSFVVWIKHRRDEEKDKEAESYCKGKEECPTEHCCECPESETCRVVRT